jgi:hypothetical protein
MLINPLVRLYDADAGNAGSGEAPKTPPVTPPTESVTPPTDAEKNHAELRKANEKLQKQLDAMQKVNDDAINAKLAEDGKLQDLVDKLTKEKADLITQSVSQAKENYAKSELAKSGLSAEAIDLLLQSTMSKLEYGEDNIPINFATVLETIKTATPALFTTPPAVPAGAKTSIGATTNPNSSSNLSQEAAIEMLNRGNNTEIHANTKAIQAALAQTKK